MTSLVCGDDEDEENNVNEDINNYFFNDNNLFNDKNINLLLSNDKNMYVHKDDENVNLKTSKNDKKDYIYTFKKYKIEPFNDILDRKLVDRNEIKNIDLKNIYSNFFKNIMNNLCINEYIEIIDKVNCKIYIDKNNIIVNDDENDQKFNHLVNTSKLYCWKRSMYFYPNILINTNEYNKLTDFINYNTSKNEINYNYEDIEYVD